jgi:hypothetical protein
VTELIKLSRYPLIVVDEVGYTPFEAKPPTCSSSSYRTDTNVRP